MVNGLAEDDAGRRGASGQRGRGVGQLGQVAAVDGERTDGADRALVHEQGVAVGADAGIDCANATGGATGVLPSSVNVSSPGDREQEMAPDPVFTVNRNRRHG